MANMTLAFFLERIQARLILTAVLAVCCSVPTLVVAQSTPENGDSQTDQGHQKSILVQADDSNPAQSSGANGKASIEDLQPQSTFVRQNLSPSPQPPKDLLTPATPTENSFTRPFVNELRGEKFSAPNTSTQTKLGTQNDGSEAVGTFATTNQNLQDQPLPGSGIRDLRGSNQGFSSPPPRTQPPRVNFNEFGGGSSRLGDMPPITSRAQAASQTPAINNDLRSRAAGGIAPISDQPSAWRDVNPNSGRNSNVQSYNMQSTAIGQSASLNSMQPLRSQESSNGIQPLSNQPSRMSFNAQPTDRFAQYNDTNRDNQVRPTGFTQPVTQPFAQPKKRSTDLAKSLIARYSLDNSTNALPGQPVKMIEMLRQPISTQQRRPMVNQFWLTYYDWANLVSDQQFEQWLAQIPPSASVADKAMLEAATAMAENNTLAAEIQLGKSQSQLAQYMPNRQSNLLPLPNDLPLIQGFRTNYELYKSQRMLPVSLLGIDQMLPKTLELIKKRADAVRIAKSAADAVVAAMPMRQATIATVLEAGDVWRSAEQDLIASVVDYNQAIGDYSLSVPHGYDAPEQIAAMLIAKPNTPSVAQNPQGQNNFQNQQSQGAGFGSNSQSQAELRRQIAAQQQNSVLRNGQGTGNNSQSGTAPLRRTAQANPNQFLNQAQREFPAQRTNPATNPSAVGQPQGQRTQGQSVQDSFNLGPSAFGGVGGAAKTSNGQTNNSVAPATQMGFGQRPPTDPFANPATQQSRPPQNPFQ